MSPRDNLIFLLILSIFGLVLTITSDELRITLTNGSKLVGRYLRSYSGRPIRAFTSIPYAKPPLGALRFKVNFSRFAGCKFFVSFIAIRLFISRLQSHLKNGTVNIEQ